MKNPRVSIGAKSMINAVVAEAAMTLPPINKPEHFDILLEMTKIATEGFWQRYLAQCEESVRNELLKAIADSDMALVMQWYDDYADFENDEVAATRAERILDEFAASLPSMLKDAYAEEFAAS